MENLKSKKNENIVTIKKSYVENNHVLFVNDQNFQFECPKTKDTYYTKYKKRFNKIHCPGCGIKITTSHSTIEHKI